MSRGPCLILVLSGRPMETGGMAKEVPVEYRRMAKKKKTGKCCVAVPKVVDAAAKRQD
jgi:hypothetical protein